MKTTKPKRDKRTSLEIEIDQLLEHMSNTNPAQEEYGVMVKNLEILYKAKIGENNPKRGVPWETIIVVLGSLLEIGIVVGHEYLGNVISSKAFSRIIRGRA